MSSDPVTTVPKYAYFEVVADGKSLGRVEFELSSKTPLTSKNFGKLCTGFTFREKQMEYKNTYFHRVIPGMLLSAPISLFLGKFAAFPIIHSIISAFFLTKIIVPLPLFYS
jgi:hypothetical protein